MQSISYQIWGVKGRGALPVKEQEVLPRVGEHVGVDGKEYRVLGVVHYIDVGGITQLNRPHIRVYVDEVR